MFKKIRSLLFSFWTNIKKFTYSVDSLTSSTISSLCILSKSRFSLSGTAIGVFLAVFTAGVMFWLIAMSCTSVSVPISPKQFLHSFKNLLVWELEMVSILLIMSNCLLKFRHMKGRRFVCAKINDKAMFLSRCWISCTLSFYCYITSIVCDQGGHWFCYFWFCLQSCESGFLELQLSIRFDFLADVDQIGIDCN